MESYSYKVLQLKDSTWNNCPLGTGFESNMYSPVTLKGKKRFLNKSEVLSLVSFNAK